MPTLEEAVRCPKCSMPGRLTSSQAVTSGRGRGGQVHVYTCATERCQWFGTGWTVQVMADGSIPERVQGPKEYPAMTPNEKAAAQRYLEDIDGKDLRDTEL